MAGGRAVIDVVNLGVVLAGGLIGALYIVSPETRRALEVNVLHRHAWYYLGKYVERPDDPDNGPGGWEGALDGCDQPERTFYHAAWDENRPFDPALIATLPESILFSINEIPTAGRTGALDDDRFSDNPIVTLAQRDQCYLVLQTAARPLGLRPGCDGKMRPATAYWAEMVRITCD